MHSRMNQRVEALETKMKLAGCKTCRDWSPMAVVHDTGDPDNPVEIPASRCPDCDREVRKVIVIKRVSSGPQ